MNRTLVHAKQGHAYIVSQICYDTSFSFSRTRLFGIEEKGRGAGAQSVTVKWTGCGFDPHSRK